MLPVHILSMYFTNNSPFSDSLDGFLDTLTSKVIQNIIQRPPHQNNTNQNDGYIVRFSPASRLLFLLIIIAVEVG